MAALTGLAVAVRGIATATRALKVAGAFFESAGRPHAKLTGVEKLLKRLKTARKKNPHDMRRQLTIASAAVERSAKKNMRGSRTRAIRLGRPVTAREGVLGIDRGTLRASINFKIRTKRKTFGQMWMVSRIGPQRVVYGRIHELGGIAGRGAVIPRRPYLGPALKENEALIKRLLSKSFHVVIPA
jgi:phage gpG-like protein